MNVELLDDALAFLDRAGPLLLEDEARHNLALGIAGTVRADPAVYPQRRFWIVVDDGRTVAAALRTPPFNVVLARPRSPEALAALADALAGDDAPGLTGAVPEVDELAALLGRATERVMAQGIYALERVAPVPRPSGAPRRAGQADRELALAWIEAFGGEVAHAEAPARDTLEALVDYRLRAEQAGILLWEDGGEVVSLAGWGGPTPNGIRVGPVYTPPALRGRGYATALVAELSQRLLDGGRRFCFLYTDLANPTSNAIYERIGYVRVCDSAELRFA